MDEKMMVSLNRFNTKLAKAQPEFEAKLSAKPLKALGSGTEKAMMKVATAAALPTGGLDDILLTFCTAWPKVRTMLNVALKFAAWVPGFGPQIALAKAFIQGFNDEIYPLFCPPK